MITIPTAEEVTTARERIVEHTIRTPLIGVPVVDGDADFQVHLKLELLQPTRSFKVRGAANRILGELGRREGITRVTTVSAGNMGLAAHRVAASQGLPATIVVPDTAPAAKVERLERLGAVVERITFAQWWAMVERAPDADPRTLFVHPFLDSDVLAGNATIGLELAGEVDDLEVVYVPFGGGGLAAGIAVGLAIAGSRAEVYGVEARTATPLRAALAAGESRVVERESSFVDGIGSTFVLPEMFDLLQDRLAGLVVVDLAEIEKSIAWGIREAALVAEGAGGAAIAAARTAALEGRRAVAIVSGGNIDAAVVRDILARTDGNRAD